MAPPRVGPCVALVLTLLLAAPGAIAGEAPAAEPARPKFPKAIQTRLDILANLALPDSARAKARKELARQGAAEALLWLAADTQSENVRMHVAIALSRLTRNRATIGQNLAVLSGWLKAEDPALHYWAVRAMANARTTAAAKILGTTLETIGAQYTAAIEAAEAATKKKEPAKALQAKARAAKLKPMLVVIARALGSMGKTAAADERKKHLLGHLLIGNTKSAALRIAGIEGMRLWGLRTPDIVAALFKVARDDPQEEVWRAAIKALQLLARIPRTELMLYPPGISKAERLRKLKLWEAEWKILRRAAGRKAG